MLVVGRRVRVGEDARHLLELERPLARGRVLEPPPQDHAGGRRREPAGELDDRRLEVEGPGERTGQPREPGIRIVAAQRLGQKRHDHELGDVGLGRRDRQLRPGLQGNDDVGDVGQRRLRVVRDRERQRALAARIVEHGDDVG